MACVCKNISSNTPFIVSHSLVMAQQCGLVELVVVKAERRA